MKQLYKHEHEGLRFSHNGHAAYLRGEKPRWMWKDEEVEETVAHHIEWGTDRERNVRRALVMFYRKKEPHTEIKLTPQ